MATSVCKPSIFMTFLYLALLLSLTNGLRVVMRQTAHCGTLSGSFKGPCLFKDNCESHCKDKEGADDGDCSGFQCYCEKNCGTVCERGSGTWRGLCVDTNKCDKQCRQKENELAGYCSGGLQCICLYDC